MVIAIIVGSVLFLGGLLLIVRATLGAYDRPPPPRLTAEDLVARHDERLRRRHDGQDQ